MGAASRIKPRRIEERTDTRTDTSKTRIIAYKEAQGYQRLWRANARLTRLPDKWALAGYLSGYPTIRPLANRLGSVGGHVHRKRWSGEQSQCKPPLLNHKPRVAGFQTNRCPDLDIGYRKRPSPATQPTVSDLQYGSFYWHLWC